LEAKVIKNKLIIPELIKSGAIFKGIWEIEVFNKHKTLLSHCQFQNLLTDEGLNHILNVILHAATQITTWYVVLSETNTAAAAGMTYAVPSFTETTAYGEATRPEYVEANSTAKSTTNSANKAVFTANASKTIYAAGLVGGGSAATTKGNTAGGGTLLCYGLFGTAQPVISGNVVNATYTLTSADAG
jgi:hypothetical protein